MDFFVEKLNRLILFFVLYTLLFLLFFGTLTYTLPFVLAFIIAYMLQKPTHYLIRKCKMTNSIASLITTFLFFALFVILLSILVGSLTTEAIQLAKNTQAYVSKNTSGIYVFIDNLQKYYQNLDPLIVSTLEKNLSGFVSKLGVSTVDISSKIVSFLLNILASIPTLIMIFFFTLLATYFFTKDLTAAKTKFLTLFPEENKDKLGSVIAETKKMLGSYLSSYMLIIFLTFAETLVGFLILRIKYALILSIVSAIADVLPILGIGAIYIPLAIIAFLSHQYYIAAGLAILYILISIIRQIVEPKLVSSSLGIHPVAALAAIFIGLTANGVSGMIFCMFLVVFYTIFKKVNLL